MKAIFDCGKKTHNEKAMLVGGSSTICIYFFWRLIIRTRVVVYVLVNVGERERMCSLLYVCCSATRSVPSRIWYFVVVDVFVCRCLSACLCGCVRAIHSVALLFRLRLDVTLLLWNGVYLEDYLIFRLKDQRIYTSKWDDVKSSVLYCQRPRTIFPFTVIVKENFLDHHENWLWTMV